MLRNIIAGLILLFMCGCVTEGNRQIQVAGGDNPVHPFPVDYRDGHTPTSLNSVRILDDSLMKMSASGKYTERKIYIERTGVRPTATNTKEVWAIIRNETDFPLQLEGRVSWFDQYQAPLEGPSAWQRIFLQPNTVATYKEMSTRTDALYYMIDIREAR